MTWSPSSLPREPRSPEVGLDAEPRAWGSLLASAQAEVLEAMGVGVVACDRSLRVLAASKHGRAILARFGPTASPELLPDALAGLVRAHDRWPARIPVGHETVLVGARSVELAWAAVVVWLSVETTAADLDAVLRRRWHLTRRQLDLVHQLRQGYRNQEIAAHLGLTTSTVKSYLSHLFDALGVRSRGEAIALIERTRRGE
jgi:DNA-binding CsgD family transcriptional regulator